MKVFESKTSNISYLIYRLCNPLIDLKKFVSGLRGYIWYTRDFIKFSRMNGAVLKFKDLYPILNEKTELTDFDSHYFYQQLWVFDELLMDRPATHVDVGSSYLLSGYISKIIPCQFIDIRPIPVSLENLEMVKADLLSLPYKDGEIESMSSLHVIEHIGLGRYGDAVDPQGHLKACKELVRTLAKGGKLYFSTPMGKNDKVCFNAHRVFSYKSVQTMFSGLRIVKFSLVTDKGDFIEDARSKDLELQNYSCGMFVMTKNYD